jgi:hypothetical protein
MKTYTISKKKTKLKTINKLQMRFLRIKMIFFGPENGGNSNNSNLVDLIVNFLWPCSTPQLEFPIKNIWPD